MAEVSIRSAEERDREAIVAIYNHYVVHTAVTFDLEPYTVEGRLGWFEQFGETGRYRLLVAEGGGRVMGYAGTTRFRPKGAYETTVETMVYCAPVKAGLGIGGRLYEALFAAIEGEDVHRIVAGYALPNEGSARLHEKFGFRLVGVFRENGRKFGKYWDVAWVELWRGWSVQAGAVECIIRTRKAKMEIRTRKMENCDDAERSPATKSTQGWVRRSRRKVGPRSD